MKLEQAINQFILNYNKKFPKYHMFIKRTYNIYKLGKDGRLINYDTCDEEKLNKYSKKYDLNFSIQNTNILLMLRINEQEFYIGNLYISESNKPMIRLSDVYFSFKRLRRCLISFFMTKKNKYYNTIDLTEFCKKYEISIDEFYTYKSTPLTPHIHHNVYFSNSTTKIFNTYGLNELFEYMVDKKVTIIKFEKKIIYT